MDIRDFLFIIDLSAVVLMVLVAYLSRRLGEALKIPPYYRILYVAAGAVFCAFVIDTLSINKTWPLPADLGMLVRSVAALAALLVALRYWRWLFAEYFKK